MRAAQWTHQYREPLWNSPIDRTKSVKYTTRFLTATALILQCGTVDEGLDIVRVDIDTQCISTLIVYGNGSRRERNRSWIVEFGER